VLILINKFYTEYIDKSKNEIIKHLNDEIADSFQGQKINGIIALIFGSIIALFMVISLFFEYNRSRFIYYFPMMFFIIYEFLIGLYLIYNTKKIDKNEDATKEWILKNLNFTIYGSVDKPYLSKFVISLIIALIIIINISIIFSSTLILILSTIGSSIFIVTWITWVTFIPKSKITENHIIIGRRFLKKRKNIKWHDILSIKT